MYYNFQTTNFRVTVVETMLQGTLNDIYNSNFIQIAKANFPQKGNDHQNVSKNVIVNLNSLSLNLCQNSVRIGQVVYWPVTSAAYRDRRQTKNKKLFEFRGALNGYFRLISQMRFLQTLYVLQYILLYIYARKKELIVCINT